MSYGSLNETKSEVKGRVKVGQCTFPEWEYVVTVIFKLNTLKYLFAYQKRQKAGNWNP